MIICPKNDFEVTNIESKKSFFTNLCFFDKRNVTLHDEKTHENAPFLHQQP